MTFLDLLDFGLEVIARQELNCFWTLLVVDIVYYEVMGPHKKVQASMPPIYRYDTDQSL